MKKTIRSIHIRDDIWDLLKKIAQIENRSMSNLIECLILNKSKEIKNINLEKGE